MMKSCLVIVHMQAPSVLLSDEAIEYVKRRLGAFGFELGSVVCFAEKVEGWWLVEIRGEIWETFIESIRRLERVISIQAV